MNSIASTLALEEEHPALRRGVSLAEKTAPEDLVHAISWVR